MTDLTKYLVEQFLPEATSEVTVLLPGGFKPPTGAHLALAQRYAELPQVKEVKVLIGPTTRGNFTRNHSMAIWKQLLIKASDKIKVEAAAIDNPLAAAYKYLETAAAGVYALAASSKGEDYARVKDFVAKHAPGAKYHHDGIQVVELPIDSKPLPYEGRKDDKNGTPVSASQLRQDIESYNLAQQSGKPTNVAISAILSNYPGQDKASWTEILKALGLPVKPTPKKANLSEGRELLSCGGAAGHMTHPYEDLDLTFKDVSNMIIAALSGKVEAAQEKLDGQNLMLSYKDGAVIAARNKGHIKDHGAKALSLKEVEQTFSGRGAIATAFTEAMRDFQEAVDRLSTSQRSKFFGNGAKFINLEILFPPTTNVVPYGATQLRFHNVRSYDLAGNVEGEDQEAARQIEGAIRQVQAENQKTYEIRTTNPVTIRKSADFDKQRALLQKQLDSIMTFAKAKPDDKVEVAMRHGWKEFITQVAKQYQYKIPQNVFDALVERWALQSKRLNLGKIKSAVDNKGFGDWLAQFDGAKAEQKRKEIVRPLELLFLRLGVYTLSNIEQLVALNPDESVREMRKSLTQAVARIKVAAKDEADGSSLQFLARELGRLKDLGGVKAILPTEGIVFKYNGKIYKLTGAFAPLNQLLGYLRF